MTNEREISDMVERYIAYSKPKVNIFTKYLVIKKISAIFKEKYKMEEDVGFAGLGFGFLYNKETANKIKSKLGDPQNLSELEKQIYGFYDGLKNKKIRNVLFAADKIYMESYNAGHELPK
ncbi:hypothetical protein HYS72_00885 [Candidatus Pacearchaeota archaeon]|nr:hypothetical protein [Candidatus Pacearchaeota archaeon]MBI2057149.1 hypothetical protein [Candidatus Pacearchaeota archaeon]